MQTKFKSVSIVIPVYNEEKTIKKVLETVQSSDTLNLEKEIIIVDDNSTDNTAKVLKKLRKNNIKVVTNPINLGKGASLRIGFQNTTGDIVIVQDADLEYSPKDYPILIRPILEGYADVVYGSRFLNSNPHRVLYFYHYLANKFITTLSNMFTNLNLSDIETGYKVFKGDLIRQIAKKLQANRFGFEPEITSRLAKVKGLRIYEVGISYFGRTYEEGKKIGWIDGVKAVFEIIRYSLFS
ncbi:MAG: glycosyltransferase family 2 protein [Candidatus Omnitrophica bacterium]|nr:glycosyltransferase family 2 protein [Candidatus Omnitrophota bacterium]